MARGRPTWPSLALAVTDLNSLTGVVRAHVAAKEANLKLIVGAEITPLDAPPVLLWSTDRAAYGRLSRLITLGRRRAAKGECRLTFDDVAQHASGLLAGVLARGPCSGNSGLFCRYREAFSDRVYLLAELHRDADDDYRLEQLQQLSRDSCLPLVAAGDVYYHSPARQPLQHVLTAIRHGVTVEQAGSLLFSNAQRYLKPLDEIQEIFSRAPDAIRRTCEIADRCTFSESSGSSRCSPDSESTSTSLCSGCRAIICRIAHCCCWASC